MIAETINPACLYALSNWYLMDPATKCRFIARRRGL